jgi:hypothetical protein
MRQSTNIARQRLANQYLTTPTLGKPEDVVSWLGAVQAQDYGSAKWAIAQRTADVTDALVEQALANGSIVRTHLLRPTWHFVTAADIRWMLDLTAPRVLAASAYPFRLLELDDATFRRSNAALTKALRDGKQMTRAEIAKVFERARVDVTGPLRFGYLMMRAELDGIVCSGARRGKQFTYALLDERVPPAKMIARDEALSRLTNTYFTTRGPATVHDMAVWSGLTITDVKRGIEIAGTGLQQVPIGDQRYWISASQASATRQPRTAHLLPNYDEYFIGFKDRSAILEIVKSSKAQVPSAAYMGHILAIDGQIAGGWKRSPRKHSVVVALNPVARLTGADERAIAGAARRYAKFLGLPVELSYS